MATLLKSDFAPRNIWSGKPLSEKNHVDSDLSVFNEKMLQQLTESYRQRGRDALLPLLQEVQAIYGWLPESAQILVAETLQLPLADIHGVIEFYSMLYNEPTSREIVRACHDPVCHLAGAEDVITRLEQEVGAGNTEARDPTQMIERVSCLGLCEQAPSALFGTEARGALSSIPQEQPIYLSNTPLTQKIFGEQLLLLKRAAELDPTSMDAYLANRGYEALNKVLELDPTEVIDLVNKTGILGRGGAMFPVGRKWMFTREAVSDSNEKFIVVNGDESEPGAFKDRVIMESDPFVIIEAATIGAYAIGAEKGWIFVRGEYPLAYERLENAIICAREIGLLGNDIMGKRSFNFDIEIRRGAGAYICGEETALFEAIEGKRGFPRKKPPFPVTHGLFQKPTAVNNIETLAALVAAIQIGVEQWRSIGTEQSPGTKLFCLSGHVRQPGVYEMPFGMTIREMIERAAGTPEDATIQAILVGGAAGVFIGPDKLDMRLTYEDSRLNDVPLGSGALMVFDDSVDLRQVAFQLSRFFSHESCGKCFPCQLGTQRQMEILERGVLSGKLANGDLAALQDIGHAMTQTSLCGLGQTAATAVLSALELWPEMYN